MDLTQTYNEGKRRTNRIGEVGYNKHGSKMNIIGYDNCKNITIQFEDGYITKNKYYRNFLIGEIGNPYDKTICNHGFIGEGDYSSAIYRTLTVQSERWYGMLRRCYDTKYQARQPSYIGCSVSEEWLNFQTFAKWYDENYY